MSHKVFIDGSEGTTGLQIANRLEHHPDVEMISIESAARKEPEARREMMKKADITILCLPDEASKQSAALAEGTQTRLIDASTAHRINPDWVYGLPELEHGQREKIAGSSRVANPGCYPTGFTLAVHPLIKAGIIGKDHPLTVNATSGYSGGGKKLIDTYSERFDSIDTPRFYGLGLSHKHLPEMQHINGLENPPLFVPSVGNFYNGMLVFVPLAGSLLKKKAGISDIWSVLSDYYAKESFVSVMPAGGEGSLSGGFIDPLACNGSNNIELFVFGRDEQILLAARLDNLGKGASGAAVQNMNIMLGLCETAGL
jgi:N-acetyl-gamma-glutamyl-phosphate reductase